MKIQQVQSCHPLCDKNIYTYSGPEGGEMESRPVRNAGPSTHSKNHINIKIYLIHTFKINYII
jgi:hypothetical protein